MNKETIYILRVDGVQLDGAEKFSTPLRSAQLDRADVFTYKTYDNRIIKATLQEMFGEKYTIERINPNKQISEDLLLTRNTLYKISAIEIAIKN